MRSAEGTATFFKNLSDDASGSLSSLFTDKHLTRAETVETISLAEYFGMRGIADALVKIDVEGAGEKVWDGAVETSKAIRYLVMEMLAPEIEAGLPARIIRETDLKAYYIRDFELVPSVDGEFEYVAPFWNWLFCRLSPSELAARLSATAFASARAAENARAAAAALLWWGTPSAEEAASHNITATFSVLWQTAVWCRRSRSCRGGRPIPSPAAGDQPGSPASRPHRLRSVGAAGHARSTGATWCSAAICIWRRWPC